MAKQLFMVAFATVFEGMDIQRYRPVLRLVRIALLTMAMCIVSSVSAEEFTVNADVASQHTGAFCGDGSGSAYDSTVVIDAESQPTVNPIELNRSELSWSERDRLKDVLASQIVLMVERLHTDFPPEAYRPSIEIKGFHDPSMAIQQSRRFEAALWQRDITRLIYMMEGLLISPVYTHTNDAVQFESQLDSSVGARLAAAIDNDDIATLNDILANEQPDLEQYLLPGFYAAPPLLQAVTRGNVDVVRLLLEAGANPDTRGIGRKLSPLFQAIMDGNDTLIQLLAESGADLDRVIGTDLRMSPIAWCISTGAIDRAALLLKLGADPDVHDYAGWTALMDALFTEDLDAVDLLLPVSDPRIESTDDITRSHRTKNLGLRFLPRGNALFLASRMHSPRATEFAEALGKRAALLDPDAGVHQLELSAQQSISRLDWFEGRKQLAIEEHRKALSIIDVPSLTEQSDGEVVSQTMVMLTELHEMLLVTGQMPSQAELANIEHITGIGGWHEPLHAMLDTIAAGREAYPAEQLDAWQAAYGTPPHMDWDFERLNTWVESIKDTRVRDRLFDVLDFFEMNGWRR